ncbi:acetyl-coenzyme A carboxyl transferase alpha chain [Nonlabens ulvanivorans]|nr:acetyl-coenzyme A carboxyl transferase alpha chain [Nonlabens ulvanivorans]
MEYLDFESPIKELEEKYQQTLAIGSDSEVDVTATCKQIEKKLKATRKEIYGNLTHGNVYRCHVILLVLIH